MQICSTQKSSAGRRRRSSSCAETCHTDALATATVDIAITITIRLFIKHQTQRVGSRFPRLFPAQIFSRPCSLVFLSRGLPHNMSRPPPSPPSPSPPSSPSASPSPGASPMLSPSPSPSGSPSRSRPQMHLTIPPSPPFNPIKPVPHPLTNPPSPPPASPPLMSPPFALPFPHLPHRSPPKRAHRPRHSERRPSPLHRTYSARDLAQLTESDEEGEGEAEGNANTESSDANKSGDGDGDGKGKGKGKWRRDGEGGATGRGETGGMEQSLQRFTFAGRNLHRGGFAGGKEGAKVIVLNDSESDDESESVELDTPTKRSSSATRVRGRALSPGNRALTTPTRRETSASGRHRNAASMRSLARIASVVSMASTVGWWHAFQVVGWGIAIILALVQGEWCGWQSTQSHVCACAWSTECPDALVSWCLGVLYCPADGPI